MGSRHPADVQAFAKRELDGNGSFEPAFGDLCHWLNGDLPALAHAAAVVDRSRPRVLF